MPVSSTYINGIVITSTFSLLVDLESFECLVRPVELRLVLLLEACSLLAGLGSLALEGWGLLMICPWICWGGGSWKEMEGREQVSTCSYLAVYRLLLLACVQVIADRPFPAVCSGDRGF